jgi:tRNA nucleotidyltransferase (CCA-adding enzyme)
MPLTPVEELLSRALALPALAEVYERLVAAGRGPLYLVGGAVRDLLRGQAPLDLDLVLDGPVTLLAERLGGTATTHDRFETATLRTGAGLRIDVARSRREVYSAPGALPAVEPAPIAQDLLRRDFTVNAMALALTGPDMGRLLTAPDALKDLSARQLRVLHERSFEDDPTRLLRLARYHARLDFQVEAHTLALARTAVDEHALATISGARTGHELRLLAQEQDPVAALAALAELGVDRAIDPNFTIERRDDRAIARLALALLPADGRQDLLMLAVALRELDPAHLGVLLRRLAFTADDRDVIDAAATRAKRLADTLRGLSRPSEIAAAIGPAGPELVALAGALGAERQARDWFANLRHVTLGIDGADLRAAGVSEGPALGAGLMAARLALLDGDAPERERQLEVAVEAARKHSSSQ